MRAAVRFGLAELNEIRGVNRAVIVAHHLCFEFRMYYTETNSN